MDSSVKKIPKKKILFITDKKEECGRITSAVEDHFTFTFTDNTEDGFRILSESYPNLMIILIEDKLAVSNNCGFLKKVTEDPLYSSASIVTVCHGSEASPETIKSLENGACDIIMPHYRKELMVKRINNAARLGDSATFHEIENMLKVLPSNIFLKDTEGKYVFATHYWHHLDHGDDPEWTIRGKTDVDIRKDRDNAMLAMKADMEIIRTGKGTSYVIEENADGVQEFLQLIKQPLIDENGKVTGIMGLINDVTEHELLKKKLKEASIIDALTGIYNRREIQAAVEKGLNESKKNGTPFSILMFDLDNFKLVNDTYGHQLGDKVLIEFANILKNNSSACAGKYLSGRWGGEEFMMVLNDTDISAAMFIAELIRQCFANLSFSGMRSQTVSIGVACAKPEDTADTLCSRVDAGLYKAKKEGKNRVASV